MSHIFNLIPFRFSFIIKSFEKFKYNNHAIQLSGLRLAEFKSIRTPSLIIHGTNDPLINYEHAKKYAILFRNSKKLYVMGWDIICQKSKLKLL